LGLRGLRPVPLDQGDRISDTYRILPAANATIAVPLACVPQPPDTGAWWSGEDNALDRLGSYPGTLANGTGYAPGLVGRAFQFDGIDDSMWVGFLGGIGLTETDPLTIAGWINTSTTGATSQTIAGNYMGEGGGIGNFSDETNAVHGYNSSFNGLIDDSKGHAPTTAKDTHDFEFSCHSSAVDVPSLLRLSRDRSARWYRHSSRPRACHAGSPQPAPSTGRDVAG
jgi:hypothetical protein